jgi:hypothetical protein
LSLSKRFGIVRCEERKPALRQNQTPKPLENLLRTQQNSTPPIIAVNSINPNYFIHGANVLMVVAYSVRDILWLRLFALAASLISIPYFVFQPTPLWAPLCWSILFAVINLVQSARLLAERRPVQLTAEEKAVCRIFADLPPRKVLQILSLGDWTNSEPGEQLIRHDKSINYIFLIVRGKVQVTRENRPLGELSAGNLV